MGSTEENALEKAFEDVIEKAFPIIHNEAPIDPTRTSDTLEDPVAKALGKVAAACKAVRQHSVISTNDELDDVSTDCLRFIMLEFWRGQLLEKESDPALRIRALAGARVAYLSFLQQLQRLELLPKEEASLVGDDMIDEDDAVKHDPAQQRMYKVSRVKRARLLRDTLEHFDWRHTYLSAASGEDGIGSAEGVAGGADELRQLACDALQEAAMRAVDALGFIKQELPLLKMMAAQRGGAGAGAAAGAGGDARLSDAEARRQRERESSRDAAFAPDRPGLDVMRFAPDLSATRETIKANLFKAGYDPPPMSLEEFGDRERAAAEKRTADAKEAEKHYVMKLSELYAAGEEDDEELHDKATEKTRAFEDWSDSVARGFGNTKRI